MPIKSRSVGLILLAITVSASAQNAAHPHVDGTNPQGIVLTGGKIVLDFADPATGYNTTTLDRLDMVTWSGGAGSLAGQNLVVEGGNGACNDPTEFSGEAYGSPEGAQPIIVYAGSSSTASNQTATTLTTTTSGLDCNGNALATATAKTTYQVFATGSATENEFQVTRTFNFSPSTATFNSTGVLAYIARLPVATYGTTLYPNLSGQIQTVQAAACPVGCPFSDWNGVWFADDNGSGTGMVVIRNVTNYEAPVQLVVNFDGSSNSNLSAVVLVQPSTGSWTAPITEIEWFCFYDPTTWTSAQQAAGTLPSGCTPQSAIDTTPDAFSFTAVTGAALSSTQTSNTVTITGIDTASPVSITGGKYSLNGAPYTSAAGTLHYGDTVAVQAVSSASYSTAVVATLTVGGVSGAYSVTTQAAPAPTVAISVNPTAITLGQAATLTWSSTNATTCSASGAWSGSEPTNGSAMNTPTSVGTKVFTLSCTGSGGSISAMASLLVNAAPVLPTVTIAANPNAITVGQSSTLTWSSTNATSCTASGAWSGTEATSGSLAQTPTASGMLSYALSCTGAGGSASATAALTVNPAPVAPTVTIAVNPDALTLGQSATLTWSSTNATSCTASGAWSGSEATSGSLSEMPTAAGTLSYTLTCTGQGGSATSAATLTVSAPPLPTLSISVAPAAITLGSAATLTWSSTDATACTASGAWSGAQSTSGSASETPTAATAQTYTLACTGAGGSSTASAVLTVNPVAQTVTTLSTKSGGGGSVDWVSILALGGVVCMARLRKVRVAVLTASLALTVASLSANADEEFGFDWQHGYLGLRAGQSTYKYSASSLDAALGESDEVTNTSTISKNQFGGALYAGVPLYRQLAIEAGYVQMGQFPLSIRTNSADLGSIAERAVKALPAAGHGVTLGFAFPWDFGDRFGVEPRFAALVYQSKQSVVTPTATYRNTLSGVGFDAGLSATLRLVGGWYLGAGVDCFHEDHDCNVVLVSGQLEYKFGR